MLEAFACPCCGTSRWERLDRHLYTAEGGSGSSDPGRIWADKLQREFFFGVWRRGENQVVLQELLCTRCGVVTYSPRPSADDLKDKYAALLRHGIQPGAPDDSSRPDDRPSKLAQILMPHLRAAGGRVLDIGGGDGRLLAELVERGVECAVVDYNQETVPGVAKLGDTLEAIQTTERFHAIVLSHVLEHVASPRDLVATLGRLLAPGAVVYAEVPVEIWRGTPVSVDPLTHVNHFAGASLRALFRCNGYRIIHAYEGAGSYNGFPLEVASVIGSPGREDSDEDPAAEVRRRLAPSVLARIRRRGAARLS